MNAKAAGVKTRNRGKNPIRNSSSIAYGQSRVAQPEESSPASVAGVVADRIHPLSDLALHEPGELVGFRQQQIALIKSRKVLIN